MYTFIHFSVFIIFLINFYFVLCLTSDEITKLPGLSHDINFKQYSGYLNASKGRHYFYWFVESQSNPQKDPLILWLNGGPGCSSLRGLLTENGPFRVSANGTTLTANPYSWNSIANVLYLESPAGTGFSFDEKKIFMNTDKTTAEDNYLALQSFFTKFPHLKNNSFYITGESYAGVYIPTLALEIFRRNSSINLKGVAIGNGLFHIKDSFSVGIDFAVSHGLISTDLAKQYTDDCCQCRSSTGMVCDFDNQNKSCNAFDNIFEILIDSDINPYNILDDCPSDINTNAKRFTRYHKEVADLFGLDFEFDDSLDENYSDNESNCIRNGYVKYLNSAQVRKAIHVPEHLQNWTNCRRVHYFDENNDHLGKNMRPDFTELISKYKIQSFIVYNGDIDIVCNFADNQLFVDQLGYKLTEKYQKWTVNGLTAGFVKRYEGISFITVRGAGHMVPSDKPEAALKIVKELIGISKVR